MHDFDLLLLSLVAEGPLSEAHFQAAIQNHPLRAWAGGGAAPADALNRLAADGLLDRAEEPEQTIYRLAAAGREALEAATVERLSVPPRQAAGFALGLANLHLLRPDQVRRALDARESRLRAEVADLNRLRHAQVSDASDTRHALQRLALFDYQLRMALAELEWLVEFRQAWDSQAPPEPAARSPFRAPVIRLADSPADAEPDEPGV
jgi:DNA-binding PadR family transcriptional regulator